MPKTLFSITALAAAIFVSAAPAAAASPLSAMAVGSTAKYRVTTQTNSPQSGAQNTNYSVVFRRVSESSIKVRIDGAKAINLTVGTDGTIQMPQDANPALQPFAELGAYVNGAPAPLAAGNTWTAVVPVAINGQSKNVSVTFKASELQENVLNVAGTGNDTIDLNMNGKRTRSANLTVNASITYGANHTITSANSTKSAAVSGGKNGKNGGKNGQYGSSWTITPM